MRVALAWLVLVLLHAGARAEPVGLVVSGGDGASLHSDVEKFTTRLLKKLRFRLAPAPLDDDAITTIANCLVIEDSKCAQGVIDARSKSQSVVFVKIDVVPPDRNVSFTTYWFVKGRAPGGLKDQCAKCKGDIWKPPLEQSVTSLKDQLGLVGDAPVVVEKPVGPTPGEEPKSRILPGIMIGVGVASLATAGVYFWYGARGGPTEKYTYPDSGGWGIAFAAVGAGLTIGGAVLWHQAGATSAPVAAVDSHGAYLGWVRQF
jgi:hypothetical protein